jgi:hypothetical protein
MKRTFTLREPQGDTLLNNVLIQLLIALVALLLILPAFFVCQLNAAGTIPENVRVRILSKYHPQLITVSAKGNYFGARGNETLFGAPKRIEAHNDKVYVTDEKSERNETLAAFRSTRIDITLYTSEGMVTHRYEGECEITAEKNELIIINNTPFERYVHQSAVAELGELPSRLKPVQKVELIRAMEIVVRSYLVAEGSRHEGYEFCDLTHCVHFPGIVDDSVTLSA